MIHLMFSSTRWASTKFVRSELTAETSASPKHGKIIFTKVLLTKVPTCPKQKRNVTPLFWVVLTFEWYEDDMAFRAFVIIFRTNGKKIHLYAKDFYGCYGNFFGKWHSESYLSYVQSLFSAIRSASTTAFWKIPYSSIFYGHGLTCVLNLSRLR